MCRFELLAYIQDEHRRLRSMAKDNHAAPEHEHTTKHVICGLNGLLSRLWALQASTSCSAWVSTRIGIVILTLGGSLGQFLVYFLAFQWKCDVKLVFCFLVDLWFFGSSFTAQNCWDAFKGTIWSSTVGIYTTPTGRDCLAVYIGTTYVEVHTNS